MDRSGWRRPAHTLRTLCAFLCLWPVAASAVGVGEESETIEEIYEPYLIQRGFLKRTAGGRVATERAYQHFNLKPSSKSVELF